MIVFDDSDLNHTIDAVIFLIYSINGERCTSPSRRLAQSTIREEFEHMGHVPKDRFIQPRVKAEIAFEFRCSLETLS